MNPVRYCQPCRQNRTHREDGSCIECGAVEAVTHPAAYRDDMTVYQRMSRERMTAARKRGQRNLRQFTSTRIH